MPGGGGVDEGFVRSLRLGGGAWGCNGGARALAAAPWLGAPCARSHTRVPLRRLIPNCLFRVGGAAMLLSNKRAESWCAPRPAGGASPRAL